tara:strand:+ start:301 stop:1002 length:702 start_codon:yes stop_codon:yes gene_type:complete
MLDIKELTKEVHTNAERQEFVKTLMSGFINPKHYAIFLYNQLICYSTVERYAIDNGLFKDTEGLQRAEHIHYDVKTLWPSDNPPLITQSTADYCKHVDSIKEDPQKLYCHIYARHLGDLSGGQMIKKKTPGPNRYYQFKDGQVKEWKNIVRERINGYLNVYQHTIVPETKLVFEYATRLFAEMKEIEPYLDSLIRVLEGKGGSGSTIPETNKPPSSVGKVMTSEYMEKNPLEQ